MQTITQLLLAARERPRQQTAYKFKENGVWVSCSWAEFYFNCETVAGALSNLGVNTGDRVAILSNTRPEWLLCDMAIMGFGAITVPIYQSQRSEEVAYILNDSQAKVIFLEDDSQWQKWQQIADSCPSIQHVVLFSGTAADDKTPILWEAFLARGQKVIKDQPDLLVKAIEKQSLKDWATLIYTSGTTGEPKGVVITHEQIASEVHDILVSFPLGVSDSSLCFLPFAHVLGRIEAWTSIASGFTLAFAENIDRLRQNLADVRPTFMVAVPRVFEKLHATILSQIEAKPAMHKIFNWALGIGNEMARKTRAKEAISPILRLEHVAADRLVFSKLRDKLGGRLRFVLSGGAPLAAEIAEFFHAIGLLLLEGYGLTETTAAICANSPLAYKFGTVGKPLGEVELKIASDGEILVRSAKVMREYYRQPEATKEVLSADGFFATGDIGEIDDEGFLRITDRKKDLIKTAGGKYVAPQKLENLLKLSPLISQALIHGDQEKYIVAMVSLNQEKVFSYAKQHQLSFQNYEMLSQHPNVRGLIRSAIADINSQLASYETIKNFAILPRELTVESGELTPSLKIRRKFCSKKFATEIAGLYD